jgi:SAM-dependent methyltransferase
LFLRRRQIQTDENDGHLRAERFVDSILPREQLLKVFAAEAGVKFEIRRPAYIVGVTTFQAEESPRLDANEYLETDLATIELEPDEYDVALCCNVLEHLQRPLDVLPLLHAGLKDAGLLVVMVPNVLSLKGLVTRFAPSAARRWFYRRVGASAEIDLASTVHSFSLRPASFRRHARNGGWRLEYWRIYEGGVQQSVRHRLGIIGWRWRLIALVTRFVSLGFVTAEGTGVIAVLRKVAETQGLPLGD